MHAATGMLSSGSQPSVDAIARAAGVSRTTFYRSFRSRAELLAELQREPEPETGRRILDAAYALLQRQTLAQLSMDELAVAARISRASLYRLFPGKPALFRALLIAYSPFEPVMALIQRIGDRPPEEFVPQLVLTAYHAVAGREGIARTLLLEVTSMTPETQEPFAQTGLRAFAAIAAYLQAQMRAGRLRTMHPLLALQGLVGSVMLHVLSTPVLGESIAGIPAGDEAVLQLAQLWLRGMGPEG
ncbi:MAG: helix-turn-helix transcriptional regulator [Chloroflexi bacterium]|nr:MAG: helix-turn-helix transcriptional regulator [Chloroflexota bacterium]TME47754.1 MAG: helix-turn-helix transcriptional regulator [Chloroflexota bacterium]